MAGLPPEGWIPEKDETSMVADTSERDRATLQRALEEIRGLDLRDQARKGLFDCETLEDEGLKLTIPSFGRRIEIVMPDGSMEVPEEIDSFSLRVLALRYIKLSSGMEVTGEWIAYRDLPGGRFYATTLVPTVEQPLARVFGYREGALTEAAAALAGERAAYGDESFVFRAFPRVPLLLVLYRGDEEFPPSSRVLFDRCCSDYLNTDDLKILVTQLAAHLFKAAGAEEETRNLLWMVE
ncbi:MAG: DUF3786 domain-containing protein [Actinobacteria bacterium]|nr:DUF3786 domain-containing protein [Actinomycetota bacterium]